MAQLVKNAPAMRETWVQSLGWEDPLEKGKATHSTILAWRIPWTVQSILFLEIAYKMTLVYVCYRDQDSKNKENMVPWSEYLYVFKIHMLKS